MGQRIYRFGEFELSENEAELRTKKRRIPLQEKPLRLLVTLLNNPQHIVTREQLRERMWESGIHVDHEQGINVAIKKVRHALSDSTEKPKYIETIAKRGYRLLVPVNVSGSELVPAPIAPEPVALEAVIPNSSHRFWPSMVHRRAYAALAAAVLSGFAIWFFVLGAQRPRSTPIRSLAVLPLRNLSPESGQDYLADGITEELITNLAQTLPHRVISRASVMRYQQSNEPVAQIARELGVEAVVEGAVARSRNRVVVTVQLIDAREDRHLWAQQYDRDMGDLLTMEMQLSHDIAGQVGSTLGTHPLAKAKSPAVDPQVYDLCLLGRYHWNKRTAAGLAKSAEYYQQAIARDPNYAPAYAGLANAYALSPSYDSIGLQEAYLKAIAAAHGALELDDSLAGAHATLGLIGMNYGAWDPVQEEKEFRRALELNPNNVTAHHWFAFYLRFVGRTNEALAEMERARELDPLSTIVNADEGFFLYGARRFEEARVRLRQAIELAPDFGQPHETLALIEWESDHPTEAVKEARAGLTLDAKNPRTLGEAGYVLALTGHRGAARKMLATVQDMIRHGQGNPSYAALLQLGLGQKSEALETLQEMASRNFGAALPGLVQWHAFDELKSDARYQKLVGELRD